MDIGRLIISLGVLFLIVGVSLTVLQTFGIPKLPGDIHIKRDNFNFYFPITTSIIISLILSIILNIFMRR